MLHVFLLSRTAACTCSVFAFNGLKDDDDYRILLVCYFVVSILFSMCCRKVSSVIPNGKNRVQTGQVCSGSSRLP